MMIIKARCVIDGTGTKPLKNQAVLVEGGLIHAILPWMDGAWGSEFLDLREATLLPGFIDTHMHVVLDPADPTGFFHPEQPVPEITLRATGNAQAALRAGITTLGDCGGPNEIIFPLRDAIRQGKLIGPRILASGAPIVPIGGHGADLIGRTAGDVAEIRAVVHQQVQAGADFIKVMATAGGGEKPGESHYGVRELTALRKEADKAGLQVAAHAHGTQGIRDCISAGIQRIEHCTFFNRKGVIEFDPLAAQAIADRGIIVSPTNVIDYRRIEKGGKGAPRAQLNQVWRQLLQHGVALAASSDAGVTDMFYDDYALIPELMVTELGMSPMQAIIACTQTASKALGLETEIGTIEPGKVADLVALDGDPLEDIRSMHNIHLVIRSGNIVYQNC